MRLQELQWQNNVLKLYNIFVLFYTCVNFWNDKIVQYTTESYLLLRDRLKRFDDQSIWPSDGNFSSICWTVECLGAATVHSRRLIIHRIVITTCFASRLDPSKWGYFANFAASAAETVPLSTLSAVAIYILYVNDCCDRCWCLRLCCCCWAALQARSKTRTVLLKHSTAADSVYRLS